MGKEPNTDSNDNSKTIHRRAKAWDGALAKGAEIVYKTSSSAFDREKIKFDGSYDKNNYSDVETKKKIAACREAYENVGIIGNIIDLMVDFGMEGIEIYHKSKPIEKFFKQWARKVELRDTCEQILKSIYRDGNVPVLSHTGKIQQEEINTFKQSLNSVSDVFKDDIKIGSKIIPFKYKVLDVMSISREGSDLLGEVIWSYQYDKSECNKLVKLEQNQSDKVKKLKEFLGEEKWNSLKTTNKITLDPSLFTMLYYKKDGFRCWANPMLWRVIDDVKFKKLIRDMDISVAEGVTNTLTIVKLGDTKNGIPPSKGKYDKMVSMLKNPHKAKTIVWDDLISIETAYPPVEKFFSDAKYKQVDNDIRSGLGVAEILVNGGGGNYSNSFLSVKTLLERLETGRQIVLQFLTEQIDIVTKSMGFRSSPYIRLTNMALTNEEVEKKFILELFDRNAISFETLLNRFGENIEIEMNRIIEEDKKRELIKEESPFALLRVGKFGPQYPNGPPSLYDLTDNNQTDLPSSQEKEGGGGGSPTGPRKRKPNTEPSAPVGQTIACNIFSKEEVSEAFLTCYEKAKNFICKEKGYDNARCMKSEDTEEVIQFVLNNIVKALYLSKFSLNYDEVMKTEAPAKLDRCVKDIVGKGINDYVKKNGKRPGKDKIKEITSKAFAICVSSIKNKK